MPTSAKTAGDACLRGIYLFQNIYTVLIKLKLVDYVDNASTG